MIEDEEPILQFPLKLSSCTQKLHVSSEAKRDDLFYCWHLEDESEADVRASGVPVRKRKVWTAWYRTMPDHQILAFASGVGFISFDYGHHGTTWEAHVKLTEAHLH